MTCTYEHYKKIIMKADLKTLITEIQSNIEYLETSEGDEAEYKTAAIKITQLFRQTDMLNSYREELRKSSSIMTWADVANKWLEQITVKDENTITMDV